MSVAHGRDVHADFPLPVALVEELLHDEAHPALVDLQRLGGAAQVRTVHHVLQHLGRERRGEVSDICGGRVRVNCVLRLVDVSEAAREIRLTIGSEDNFELSNKADKK